MGMAEQRAAPQTEEEGNAQPVEAGICDLGDGLDVYSFPNLFIEPHKHKYSQHLLFIFIIQLADGPGNDDWTGNTCRSKKN